MRGRHLYRRYRSIIKLLGRTLGYLPGNLAAVGLDWFRSVPGILGFTVRYLFLKRLAHKCGEVVAIYPGAYLRNVEHLEIGDHVSIHEMCYLECAGGLRIGSNVSLSHSVSIITHEHDYLQTNVPVREAPLLLRPVEIGDDVWIGAGARILGGVVIGHGAVIGAGAVVTKSVLPGSVAVGVPARVIGVRENGRLTPA